MIPSTMAGTTPQALPAGGVAQTATPAATPGHIVPPGELFPPPVPTKASLGLLLGPLISGAVLAVLAARVVLTAPSSQSFVSRLLENFFLCFSACALLIWALVLICLYLYRAWRLIQLGNVRTTPGKAIGFWFIPGFGFYWFFVLFVGLANDWNRVMAAHPNLQQGPRLNSGLALAFCIGSFFVVGAFLIFPLMADICKGITWMGRLHMMPKGSGPGGTTPQAGGALRLY